MLTTCTYCKEEGCGCNTARVKYEDATINQAIQILKGRMQGHYGIDLEQVQQYVWLRMAVLEHEEFACVFFNTHQQLIEYKVMSIGTIDQCAIYPREFVKAALSANATYVVLAHNHPGGQTAPSHEDIQLTQNLQKCYALIDVEVCDHLIITADKVHSMLDNKQMLKLPT